MFVNVLGHIFFFYVTHQALILRGKLRMLYEIHIFGKSEMLIIIGYQSRLSIKSQIACKYLSS